jgi:hypothetical protein
MEISQDFHLLHGMFLSGSLFTNGLDCLQVDFRPDRDKFNSERVECGAVECVRTGANAMTGSSQVCRKGQEGLDVSRRSDGGNDNVHSSVLCEFAMRPNTRFTGRCCFHYRQNPRAEVTQFDFWTLPGSSGFGFLVRCDSPPSAAAA